jgi:hypothetical protein
MWLLQNAVEHDPEGDPEPDKLSSREIKSYQIQDIYKESEIHKHVLATLPKDNLQMIVMNTKIERQRERQRQHSNKKILQTNNMVIITVTAVNSQSYSHKCGVEGLS